MDYSEFSGRVAMCFKHESNILKRFCLKCSQFVCDSCIEEHHVNHETIVFSSCSAYTVAEIKRRLLPLCIRYQEMFALHKVISMHRQRLLISREYLTSKIIETYHHMTTLISVWKDRSLKELDRLMSISLQDTCKFQEATAHQVEALEKILHKVACLMKTGTDMEIYNCRSKMYEDMERAILTDIESLREKIFEKLSEVYFSGPLICKKCTDLFGFIYAKNVPLIRYYVTERTMQHDLEPMLKYLTTPEGQVIEQFDFFKILLNSDDLVSWDENFSVEDVRELFQPRKCCSGTGYLGQDEAEGDSKAKVTHCREGDDFMEFDQLSPKKVVQAKQITGQPVHQEGQRTRTGRTSPRKSGPENEICEPSTYPATEDPMQAKKKDPPSMFEKRKKSPGPQCVRTIEGCGAQKYTAILGWCNLGTNKATVLTSEEVGSLVLPGPAVVFIGNMKGTTDDFVLCNNEGIFFNLKYGSTERHGYIYWSEMTKCYYNLGYTGNMLGVTTNSLCTARLRVMCNMMTFGGPYYDPNSKDIKKRYVVICLRHLPSRLYMVLAEMLDKYQELLCRAKSRHVFQKLTAKDATRFFKETTGGNLLQVFPGDHLMEAD